MSVEDILPIIQTLENMESSSSSEDEEYVILANMINNILDVESHAKINDFVDKVVSKYSDADFKKHFRLERCTCSGLTKMFEQSAFCPASERPQGGGSKIFPAEDYILVFLWFAGNKATYREVGNLFGIAESTVMKIIDVVMNFLIDVAPIFIRFPTTTAGKQALADEFFQLAGFRNVIGCVDGSYIDVHKPVGKIRSTYINRHDDVSITLQGVCDANKRFLDVFTGSPSKIHDSRVFRLSPLSATLENICEGTFHVLADAAYELREWMLTPYRSYELLSPAKKRFNDRFCSTRVVIENAFGILKRRFLQLLLLYMWDVDRLTKFIISCCVLHNICVDANDDHGNLSYDDHDNVDNDDDDIDSDDGYLFFENTESARRLRQRGELKRDAVCVAMQ